MRTVWTNEINSETYQDALQVRKNVFVKEQGIDIDVDR